MRHIVRRVMVAASAALFLALLAPVTSFAASGDYVIQADIVRSAGGTPQGPVCVPNSVFLPGEAAVFRAKVFDATSGEVVGGERIAERGLQVVAELSDGQTFDLRFVPHPPDPNAPAHDNYWVAAWAIPADYPAGNLEWSITAADNAGRTGEFAPIGQNIGLPNLMVIPAGGGR